MTGRKTAHWITAGVLLLGLTAGCGSAGPNGGSGSDPAGALEQAGEQAAHSGSTRVHGTTSLGGGQPINYEGTLSWSSGTAGELSYSGAGTPTVVRFTDDAAYMSMPPSLSSVTGGKPWGKVTYADMASRFGGLGQVGPALMTRTFPARSAATLRQAGDLRRVGDDQLNGVSATHYTGTVELATLVADLNLGLSDEVITGLRQELQKSGVSSEQLDIWVDQRGYPVRQQAHDSAGTATVDYTDYGGPQPISAPPADQVFDMNQLLSGLPR